MIRCGTKKPSVMFPNPFQIDSAPTQSTPANQSGSEGHPAASTCESGQCSEGTPTATQADNSRGGFVLALRRCNLDALARRLGGDDHVARLHGYSEIAAPSWVVDAGASYDVVPIGVAATKSWGRFSRREPLGTHAASGRVFPNVRGRVTRSRNAREHTGR